MSGYQSLDFLSGDRNLGRWSAVAFAIFEQQPFRYFNINPAGIDGRLPHVTMTFDFRTSFNILDFIWTPTLDSPVSWNIDHLLRCRTCDSLYRQPWRSTSIAMGRRIEKYPPLTSADVLDLRRLYSDHQFELWYNLDICRSWIIEFFFSRGIHDSLHQSVLAGPDLYPVLLFRQEWRT